jgi:hypothetical protein
MSTKSSIAYDESFHFYNECFVDHLVYLQLEYDHPDFKVYPENITVGIKVEDMDKIASAWIEHRKKENT